MVALYVTAKPHLLVTLLDNIYYSHYYFYLPFIISVFLFGTIIGYLEGMSSQWNSNSSENTYSVSL